jgi:hypothetical protein
MQENPDQETASSQDEAGLEFQISDDDPHWSTGRGGSRTYLSPVTREKPRRKETR